MFWVGNLMTPVRFIFFSPSLFVILFRRSSHGRGLAGVAGVRTPCEEQYPFSKMERTHGMLLILAKHEKEMVDLIVLFLSLLPTSLPACV